MQPHRTFEEHIPSESNDLFSNPISEKSENVTSNLSLESPIELTVSELALSFDKTAPNKPKFLLVQIAQRNTSVAVTIDSDEPALFQFATDSHPIFSSQLSFTPKPEGTYVHVRYAPTKPGTHRAHLRIHTPYHTESTIIPLTGKCTWFSSDLFISQATNTSQAGTQPTPSLIHPALVVAGTLFLGFLAYQAYEHRCQLVPSWCQQADASTAPAIVVDTPMGDSPTTDRPSTPVSKTPRSARDRVTRINSGSSASEKRTNQIRSSSAKNSARVDKGSSSATNQPPSSSGAASRLVEKPNSKPIEKPVQVKKPVITSDESDLERELNRKSNN
jgi:hypothetical protein